MDGLLRCRGGVLHRLLHVGGDPVGGDAVHVRVAQLSSGNVLFGARAAYSDSAHIAIERMRRALGVDHDLGEFHRRFSRDPVIGRAIREWPGMRVRARPDPFEALAWAITEQLIEYERAVQIQRRLIAALGRRCPASGLRDSPTAPVLAAQAPALLESFDLSGGRSLALLRAAREVASGRIDLEGGERQVCWRALKAIPGVGSWTIETLALTGQGCLDQIPAGDLGYLKLVGKLTSGDPQHRASEEEVRAFFAPYAPWQGLAGTYALTAHLHGRGSRNGTTSPVSRHADEPRLCRPQITRGPAGVATA
jgi:3-methyladenine DNA glycosylase/8-oxoguanine DNA glycosylase